MRSPQSYAESAELALQVAEEHCQAGHDRGSDIVAHHLQRASVFATLAVASATVNTVRR